MAHDAVGQRAPQAGVAGLGLAAAEERQADLVELVAEAGDDGGEHGERADDGDGDHEDRGRPMLMNVELSVSSMPAIAAMTVRPESRTARPEVAAAMSIASSLEWPLARSSRWRRM